MDEATRKSTGLIGRDRTKRAGDFARALKLLIGTLCLIASLAAPGLTQDDSDPPTTRDITDTEIGQVMDLVMEARPREAISYLDALENECSGQPLFLLTRGRVLIEFIPVDDHKKDYTKEISEPALSVFDEVIEICSKTLENEDAAPESHLYRGWSWMQKSHIRALGRSFYTAGRSAGKGKKDLEEYLGEYPDHPSANGLLGAFLYFTDAIPSIFKFLSKLLFLPTGDRDRGLDMMHRAVQQHNVFAVDYTQLLNNVNVFFEGRYEEGLQGAVEFVDRYPSYPRPTIALSVAGPFAPLGYTERTDRVERVVSTLAARDQEHLDVGSLNIVRAALAYSTRIMGTRRGAIERFEDLLATAPTRADWVESFAQFQLGQLYAGAGWTNKAKDMLRSAIDNDKSDLFRDPAKRALEDLDEFDVSSGQDMDERWIETIYTLHPDSLTAIAARCEASSASSLRATFYLGECKLLLGDRDSALGIYEDLAGREAPAWEQTYQLIACSRAAEIVALLGDYERAVDYQKRAMDFYQNAYRVDWMIEGRQRYFERLGNGDAHAPEPTLLLTKR